MTYILAFFILSFLIFIHELGHFLASKYYKIPVKAFAIGFGPAIFKKKWGETEYRINILPLGGYVQPEGEQDDQFKNGLVNQKGYKRFVVLVAGIIFNFVLAMILFGIMGTFYGEPERGVKVFNVVEDSIASHHLEVEDHIVSINGHELNHDNFTKLGEWKEDTIDGNIVLDVRRGEEYFTVEIPKPTEPDTLLGINYGPAFMFVENDEHGLAYNMLILPFKEFLEASEMILNNLKMLVTGQVKIEQMQGPVGIVKTTGDIAQESIPLLLYWTALISINLGIMNALPIPALDGGQILFLFIEKIVGKERWNYKISLIINACFILALLCLMLFITYHDITRLFQ